MAESSQSSDHPQTAIEVAAGAVSGGIGLVLGGPIGALAGAAIPPLTVRAMTAMRKRLSARREARAGFVVAIAARKAGVDADELLSSLEADPEREELLVRTLQVAQEAAAVEKLVALALSLSSAYENGAHAERTAWEASFIRALADCDSATLQVLQVLAGSSVEQPESRLTRVQLQLALPGLETLVDSLLSILERHGLVRGATTTRGMMIGIGPESVSWGITPFGNAFLDRMNIVRESIQPPRDSEAQKRWDR